MSEERLERIEQKTDALTSRVDGLTSRVGGLTSRVDGLTSGVDGLTSRVDGLTSRVDGLTSRVGGLTSRVGGVEAGQQKLTVLFEEQHHVVLAIADGLVATNERMDRGFASIEERFDRIDLTMNTFVRAQSGANRELIDKHENHERRIVALEKRRKGAR